MRSISRAAEANGISQSAASQHLDKVEETLEMKLVDRSTRPLVVTDAGRLYMEFCRDVLRLKNQFEISLEGLKGEVRGVVRVGSIYSVGISEMSCLEEEFHKRWPKAELVVEYLRPENVYKAVVEEAVDLGLVSYPEADRAVSVTPWREERMVVAFNPKHALASLEKVLRHNLAGQHFVGFDQDLPIARDVKRYLKDAGVEVHEVMHFDNIQTMKEAVAIGSGIAILPERILHPDIEQGRLVTAALEPPLSRPLGILQLRKKQLNRATQSFLNLLLETKSPSQPAAV